MFMCGINITKCYKMFECVKLISPKRYIHTCQSLNREQCVSVILYYLSSK